MAEETQQNVPVHGLSLVNLLGEKDRHLRAIEEHFGVRAVARDGALSLQGPAGRVAAAARLFEHLVARVRDGEILGDDDVRYALDQVDDQTREGADGSRLELEEAEVVLYGDRRVVKVRSVGQTQYLKAMRAHDIVFSVGPAGTGKTYLAVAMAVRHLKEKRVDRIVLVRPAVEAGESLGFLPGDLQEKVDPYLRPLYDALRDMISYEKLQRFLQLGVIEVVPLAYMRGRTLSRAFVILDEAQNSTLPQMKMFLTRLGPDSRAVITGDITQIDLADPADSGLVRIRGIVDGIRGIAFIELDDRDVVRHRLVRDIIQAFHRQDRRDDGAPQR
jgi:phosphate starvation-inducible PhoH-like protein